MNQFELVTTEEREIRELHYLIRDNVQKTLSYAFQLGERLLKEKERMAHGEWLPFLERVEISPRWAQRYMQVARERDKLSNASACRISSLRGGVG